MNMLPFKKITLIGVGLIGGSIAAALKTNGFDGHIVGFDQCDDNLRIAKERGLIDRIGENVLKEVEDSDLIVLAVPVGAMESVLLSIVKGLSDRQLIIDVGSTKMNVIEDVRKVLQDKTSRFIPTHPIAGAEKNGAAAAISDLFMDHRVVVTPLLENSVEDVQKIKTFWTVCGADVYEMSPEQHDQFFAAISHLPHVLSFGLVYDIATRPNGHDFLEYAAGGFRDFSRIAASSPEMWRDICLANKKPILDELKAYEKTLSLIKEAMIEEDGEKLRKIFDVSREARQYWAKQKHW